MTPAAVARIFDRCTTVRRCLLAANGAERLGLPDLRDALFARAMELHSGEEYPWVSGVWRQSRQEALDSFDTEPPSEAPPTLRDTGIEEP